MKRSLAARQDQQRLTNLEAMVAEIYRQTTGKDPAEFTAQQQQAINTDDGVDDTEASTAGRALRQRRAERQTATTTTEASARTRDSKRKKGDKELPKADVDAVNRQGAIRGGEGEEEATA